MCACMINDSKFNKLAIDCKTTFQKVLLKKCSDVFYTITKYQQELNKFKEKMKNDKMVNSYVVIIFCYDLWLLFIIIIIIQNKFTNF